VEGRQLRFAAGEALAVGAEDLQAVWNVRRKRSRLGWVGVVRQVLDYAIGTLSPALPASSHRARLLSHSIRECGHEIRELSHKFREICHRARGLRHARREICDRARCRETNFVVCVTQLAN
jgi:hypothetical protein